MNTNPAKEIHHKELRGGDSLFKDLLDPLDAVLGRVWFLFRFFSCAPSRLAGEIKAKIDASSYTASAGYVVISCFVAILLTHDFVDLKGLIAGLFSKDEVATAAMVTGGVRIGELVVDASFIATIILVLGGICLRFRWFSADEHMYNDLRRLYHLSIAGTLFVLALSMTTFVVLWSWVSFSLPLWVNYIGIFFMVTIMMGVGGVFQWFFIARYIGEAPKRSAVFVLCCAAVAFVVGKAIDFGRVRPQHYIHAAVCSRQGFEVDENSATIHIIVRKYSRYKDPIYLQGGAAEISGEYFHNESSKEPDVCFTGHLMIDGMQAPQLVPINGDDGRIVSIKVTKGGVTILKQHGIISLSGLKNQQIKKWEQGDLDLLRPAGAYGHLRLHLNVVGDDQRIEERVFDLPLRV